MLEWKIRTGDEKLKDEINTMKETFDVWFKQYWAGRCTREEMLSENSPLKHVYYKMIKNHDEIKKEFPYGAKEMCLSCGEYVDNWLEARYDLGGEYDLDLCLCKNCINKLKEMSDGI